MNKKKKQKNKNINNKTHKALGVHIESAQHGTEQSNHNIKMLCVRHK